MLRGSAGSVEPWNQLKLAGPGLFADMCVKLETVVGKPSASMINSSCCTVKTKLMIDSTGLVKYDIGRFQGAIICIT